eukprot:TRINITY_DN11824_c0_g1_i3.p1 TRINITY_DN11824_c0_g1~~TRINITY_DN11824_c0_g1_i3.p1  ORF type:complete len:128 (+),score=6.23 TRINITY_DN11824_c0_g1_i3:172-555(+)
MAHQRHYNYVRDARSNGFIHLMTYNNQSHLHSTRPSHETLINTLHFLSATRPGLRSGARFFIEVIEVESLQKVVESGGVVMCVEVLKTLHELRPDCFRLLLESQERLSWVQCGKVGLLRGVYPCQEA